MADAPKAFHIDAADGIEVSIDDSSEQETFNVSVKKLGAEIESHENVSVDDLAALKSEHFSVEMVEPPTAPDED